MSAYIAMGSNSRRKHSYLGYISPNEEEKCARVASLRVRFSLTTTDSRTDMPTAEQPGVLGAEPLTLPSKADSAPGSGLFLPPR